MKLALAFAAAMLMTGMMAPAPAAACRNSCTSSNGGTPVPAPGVAALFALGVAGLVARNRRQRG